MALAAAAEPTAEEIVRRSVAANEADWREAPNYSFVSREVEDKHAASSTIKSYEVSMIDGSPYNKLIAVNDRPLFAGEQAEEQRKLDREVSKRRSESNRERTRRIAKYVKERNQDHAMMKEMADAFIYSVSGLQRLNGRQVWVLEATPKPGYAPHNREAKVLTGMQGKLWIDQGTYQWVRVEAEVVKPVSFFGFLARVGPGTKFVLDQAPVTERVWLPTHFSMRVKATALGFINENSVEDDTYRDYRPLPKAMSDAQSTR
jgi:hypothetical protein